MPKKVITKKPKAQNLDDSDMELLQQNNTKNVKAKPRKVVCSEDGISSEFSEDENGWSGEGSGSDCDSDLPVKKPVAKPRAKPVPEAGTNKSSGKKKFSGRKTRGVVPEFNQRKYSWESESEDILDSESGSEEQADCELKKKIDQAMHSGDSDENYF